MIAARQIAFGRGGRRLPYDAEVEYLESTGTQYIDTGWLPTLDSSFDTEMLVTDYASNPQVGCKGGGAVYNLHWSSYGLQIKYYMGLSGKADHLYGYFRNVSQGVKRKYSYDGLTGNCVMDQKTYKAFVLDGVPNLSFFLCAVNGSGKPSLYVKGKTYSFKAYEGGVIVCDCIPVRKGNVGYMYDRVSGQLFGNSGTGAFIIGPDAASANRGGV